MNAQGSVFQPQAARAKEEAFIQPGNGEHPSPVSLSPASNPSSSGEHY